MADSTYDLYTESGWNPSREGGRKRASLALRDRQGRFTNNPNRPLDPQHGKPGGIKRAATARREKGRFA